MDVVANSLASVNSVVVVKVLAGKARGIAESAPVQLMTLIFLKVF